MRRGDKGRYRNHTRKGAEIDRGSNFGVDARNLFYEFRNTLKAIVVNHAIKGQISLDKIITK